MKAGLGDLKTKVGVLGGTFDPVHNGHLMVAEEARVRLGLAEVLFVPAGRPWLKESRLVLAAKHRVHMVSLAVAAYPYFKLSTVEVDRAGPSYSVDTIEELQARLGGSVELYFILGQDNLAEMPEWREPARLVTMCHLVAVPRPGYSLPAPDSLEAAIPGLLKKLILLPQPEVDIDATEIRQRVARGQTIDHLVPKPVAAYIKQYGIYLK